MDFSMLKDFQSLIGVIIGFLLARIGIKLDRKVQAEKSKEMYFKQYMIYQNQINWLLKTINQFVFEGKRDQVISLKINRMCDSLKKEFLAFPIDTIPKEIFLKHRELLQQLVNFQLDMKMEMEFEDAIIVNYDEHLMEYEENYSKLCNKVFEIEQYLGI